MGLTATADRGRRLGRENHLKAARSTVDDLAAAVFAWESTTPGTSDHETRTHQLLRAWERVDQALARSVELDAAAVRRQGEVDRNHPMGVDTIQSRIGP